MHCSGAWLAGTRAHHGSLFKQLVEFTSVQPNATTGGAIVNFNALSISHG